ncbi:MAG: hypothetical protein AB7U85_01535 [Alphaproteobacteria bacterium]
MAKFDSNFLSSEDAVKKFSNIVIERGAGKNALRSEVLSFLAKEGINPVRKSGRTPVINPILASKNNRSH